MQIGYSPCLNTPQEKNDPLIKAGCEKIFESHDNPPNPQEAIAFAKPEDTLVVSQLSHLAHSLKTLLECLLSLTEKNIHLQCLNPPFHTKTTPLRDLYKALHDFPKEIAKEKARLARESAKKKGEKGGRPPKIPTEVLEAAQALYEKNTPIRKICQTLRIGKSSLYRILKIQKTGINGEITQQ
jgi:DNA invertase Pin-like site-specific DNA recombinase